MFAVNNLYWLPVPGGGRSYSSGPPGRSDLRMDPPRRSRGGTPGRELPVRLLSTPAGNVAAYYPETNPLVPLDHVARKSNTPVSKAITIRLEPHTRSKDTPEISRRELEPTPI